jgi:hypothetical protein
VRLRKSRAVRCSVDQPVARPKPGDSSHAVAPTTGFNPTRPAHALGSTTPKGKRAAARRQLSWSSFPLRRLSPDESTPPRLASPGTFRPQGLVPSRRLAPRLNVRPCFMPETPMGFSALQGLSLTARFPGSSPRNCLLDVSPHTNNRRCVAPVSARRNALLGPFPPPRPCSDSESVPSPDCYVLRNGRSPPELRSPLQGIALAHRPRHRLRGPLLRFSRLGFCVEPWASPRSSAEASSSNRGQAHDPPPTVSSSNHETSPRSSSDSVLVQPRDEPAVVLGQTGCAPAVSPESAGSRSVERNIPS